MWININDYHDFYNQPIGQKIADNLAMILYENFLYDLSKKQLSPYMVVYGYGVAICDILQQYYQNFYHDFIVFPSWLGAKNYPSKSLKNRSLICEQDSLPFTDMQCDYIILCHALEHAHDADYLLQQCHDVLSPHGQLIIIVPSRVGLWARSAITPFGQGKPYSLTQISYLLQQNNLQVTNVKYAFHGHPYLYDYFPKIDNMVNFIIKNIADYLGGLLIINAVRDEYLVQPVKKQHPITIPSFILQEKPNLS